MEQLHTDSNILDYPIIQDPQILLAPLQLNHSLPSSHHILWKFSNNKKKVSLITRNVYYRTQATKCLTLWWFPPDTYFLNAGIVGTSTPKHNQVACAGAREEASWIVST